MRFEHVVNALREQPWAMEPSAFETLVAIVARRVDIGKLSAEEIRRRSAIAAARTARPRASVPSPSWRCTGRCPSA
jgi:hypothetical protein